MTPHFRVPDLLNRYRRVHKDVRRAVFAFWSTQTVAGILLVAIAASNIALFLTATPRPPAHALVSSFTEDFTTTTYRDTANTDGTWLGDGGAYLGTGSASSTRFFFENQSAGITGFNGISCSNADTCYMTQGNLTGVGIYRTTDGGDNWEMVYGCDGDSTHCDGNSQANGLYAVPGTNVVYVAGDDQNSGMVLKSTDGGTSWTAVNSGLPTTTQFHNISCVDENYCVVVGDNLGTTPRLRYTTNGGSSWSSATLPSGSYSLRGVDFINDGASTTWRAVGTNGKVISSKATSSPGGWTIDSLFTGHTLRGIEHLSYGTIFVAGGTNSTDSFMASSTDDGATYATTTHAMTRHIYDMECGDADTCWAVGGPTSGAPQQQRSDDGGLTWTLLQNHLFTGAAQLLSMSAVDGSTAWAAGGGNFSSVMGLTSTSTDFDNAGINRLCVPSGSCDTSFSSFPGRAMWLNPTDGQVGYMAGDNGGTGYVAKTYNGGQDWSLATSSNPGRINAIDCVTTDVCFGAGVFGFLTKTTNGGTSWTTQTQTAVFNWNAHRIDAVTSQAAWVTGTISGSASRARIVRTEDGGTTYTAATGTLSSSFIPYALWGISTTTAWIGGRLENGSNDTYIYFTTDGGTTWTQQFLDTGTSIAYDMYCLPDNQTCWSLLSDTNDLVVKTTDGGATWTRLTHTFNFSPSQFSQIEFINSQVGFISGDGCSGGFDKFYTTINGGTSWTKRSWPCVQGAMAHYQNKVLVGGSQNSNGLIGRLVFAFDTTSTLQSATIDNVSADVQCAGITPSQTLNNGTVTYTMSNDGGSTWTSSGGGCSGISDTHEFAFSSTGSDLRWRAVVTGQESSPPTTTPAISELSINYVTNSVPSTPTNTSPSAGATNVLLSPTLSASAFSDADVGDTHQSSRWEVTTVAGNYASPVYSTTSTTNLESITIPTGTLAANTTYYWHVKYVDASGGNSAFSTETAFTTLASTGNENKQNTPPTAPIAVPEKTERASRSLLWRFQDTATTEQGFSIVSTQDQSKVYASTNPIFTQDAFELKEGNLAPAVEHCNRAVIAFNDQGNSKITASSTYPCTWTLPDAPEPLDVTTSTPTTITLGGIAEDDNPSKVVYEICETTTGLCLAPGSEVAAAEDGFTAAASETTYVLSKKGAAQTKEQWGEKIVVVGLQPETVYAFAATAYNPNGDAATGKDEKGETIVVEGETTAAPVKFSIVKEVAINPVQAALAGIGFAADFSFAALALMALAGMGWYLTLHRKSGSVRCAAGLCRIFAHHTRSYAATVADAELGPPLSRHARVHGFTQGTLAAALGALALKGAVFSLGLLAPIGVFGQGEFTGDGLPVASGDVIVYQIVLKNAGPSDATDVFLQDALPAQLEFVSGSLAVDGIKQTDACDIDWLCVAKGAVVMKRPALKLGEVTAVTFSAKVVGKTGDTVINTACVTAAQLTTPTCADKTANPIGISKPQPKNENLNQNTNENQNVNLPTLLNVNRALVNGNVNRPPPVTNVNQNANANQNVNAPTEEPPLAPPPFTEATQTNIKINQAFASAALVIADATPDVSGTGQPGSLVSLRIDGTLVGVAFVQADGTWRFTLREPLADGVHTVTVSLDGVVFDSAQFGVDTRAPAAVDDLAIVITKVNLAVSIRAALTGQAAGSDATIQVSGRTGPDTRLVRIRVESDPIEVSFVPPSTSWTREITGRFDPGEHVVTATAYDAAGNESASARKSFIVPEPEALQTPLAFLDDPQIEAAAVISAPIVVGFAAVNVAVATGIPTLFNFLGLLLTQPALLFARKEKKGYGTVFNALSKLPIDLAIVRIRDRASNRVLQTKVTDRLGRYVLFLKPGSYAVEVTKPGFLHPTSVLAGKTEDVAYTDLLSAPVLETLDALRLAKNIPLDPQEDQRPPAAITRTVILRKIQYAFALSGPVLSLLTLLVTPTLTVLGLTVLQVAVFALFRRLAYKKPPKSFGIVRDEATGKPLANAVVRIFETTYNKLLETQVTDARGRYAFIVGQSRYYVTAQAPGYATVTTPPIDFTSVEKGGLVTSNVTLKRA